MDRYHPESRKGRRKSSSLYAADERAHTRRPPELKAPGFPRKGFPIRQQWYYPATTRRAPVCPLPQTPHPPRAPPFAAHSPPQELAGSARLSKGDNVVSRVARVAQIEQWPRWDPVLPKRGAHGRPPTISPRVGNRARHATRPTPDTA